MRNERVDIIGSYLMYQLFDSVIDDIWGVKGLEKIEQRMVKRIDFSKVDFDVLVLDNSSKEEITEYVTNTYSPSFKRLEIHYIPPLVDYLRKVDMHLYNLNIFDSYERLKLARNILFTLKASHLAWDTVHKKKTFYDIYLMSHFGCKIIPELYYELIEFWKNKFGERWRADFTKESKEFFTDNVSREELHDELHWKMKKFDKPAYMYLQEENQTTVYVDPEKFWKVDEEIRRRVIIEEAQTLAVERFIEPGTCNVPKWPYIEFVEGLVDRLAPLWMTEYILNNFSYFIDYEEDYIKKFKELKQIILKYLKKGWKF